MRTRAELHWSPDDRTFEEFKENIYDGASSEGIELEALALLVLISTPYLKKADIVHQVACSDLSDEDRIVVLTNQERPKALCAPFHGASVDVFLYLDRALTPRPLHVWQLGTWLAKERFVIATRHSEQLFLPKPLTKEKLAEFNLPEKTMRYVRMDDANLFDSQELRPVELYVDTDLLDELSVRPNSSVSQTIQLQLVQDVLSAIIYSAGNHGSELERRSWDELSETLIGRVIRIAAKAGSSHEQLLLDVVQDPGRVLAHAEAALRIVSPARDSVRESMG